MRTLLFTAVFLTVVAAGADAASYSTRLCNRASEGGLIVQPTTLGMAQGGFTTNGNIFAPRFLTMISYFGAMREQHDPTYMMGFLCGAGFNGIRIFAEYWRNLDYCGPNGFVTDAYAVIKSDGVVNKTAPGGPGSLTNISPLEKLKLILRHARQVGLVVDLSFGHEVVQNRSMDDLEKGLKELSWELRDQEFNHVMIDVQNEFNFNGCGGRRPFRADIPRLISAAKFGDPANGKPGNANRVVFASSASSISGDPAMQADLGGDLLAVYNSAYPQTAWAIHEPRDATWYSTPVWQQVMDGARAHFNNFWFRIPIYAQEPCAAHYGFGCAGLTSYDLYRSLRHAITKGVAAWVFHTESLFFPAPGPSIQSELANRQWLDSEKQFMGWPGFSSVYNAISAVTGACWGLETQWMFSSCVL